MENKNIIALSDDQLGTLIYLLEAFRYHIAEKVLLVENKLKKRDKRLEKQFY